MAAGADLDLRSLADVARDRSAAGRARLFALLAALLVTRWSSLTSGERTQLAELVAVLWSRGDAADRQRLATDLADHDDVPASLQPLIAPLQAPAPSPSTSPPSTSLPLPATADTQLRLKSHNAKTVTVVMRQSHERPPARHLPGDRLPGDRLPGEHLSGERPSGDRLAADRMPPRDLSAAPPPPVALFVPTPLPSEIADDATPAAQAADTLAGNRDADATHTLMPDDLFFASAAMSAADHQPEATEAEIASARTASVDDEVSAEDGAPVSSAPMVERLLRKPTPILTEPRDNPHRLTSDLLSEVLVQGDLARFEVMLAHLTQVRAPLLRRLLRDSGNESLAILGRAIGLESAIFQQQWRDWRQHMVKLDPAGGLPDRRDGQRVGAFFAALTDQQVDRLIQRWRDDGTRLFRGVANRA